MRNQKFWKFIAGCIRFWLGFILLSAGVTKMFHGHFIQLIGPPWMEGELEKYNLGFYSVFIAYSQIVIGFMLLVKRFATLGAVMATPMFANILMITISLHWHGTPYVVTFFLLCNIYLLIYDYHKIKFLITDDSKPIQNIPVKRNDIQLDILYIIGLIIILIAVSIRGLGVEFSKILAYIGLGSFVGVYGFGFWKNRSKQD
jgi:uncharacterized membrane protein YphA (DoxX/SURF4 family)